MYFVSYKENWFNSYSVEKFQSYFEALEFFRFLAHEDYTLKLRLYYEDQ